MGKKILIIDDDQDYSSAITTLLETKGFSVVSATNGQDGYNMAIKEKPDLILLDVMMRHDSDGLELALKMKDDAVCKNIPVILATGIKKPAFLQQSYTPGEKWNNVKATLEKPVKPDTILAEIKKILG